MSIITHKLASLKGRHVLVDINRIRVQLSKYDDEQLVAATIGIGNELWKEHLSAILEFGIDEALGIEGIDYCLKTGSWDSNRRSWDRSRMVKIAIWKRGYEDP